MNEILLEQVQQCPYPMVFASVSGAHLYGFPSKNSDYDLRGAYVLPLKDVIGLDDDNKRTINKQSISPDNIEIDFVAHDIKKYFGLLLKKDGNCLEQLFGAIIFAISNSYDART